MGFFTSLAVGLGTALFGGIFGGFGQNEEYKRMQELIKLQMLQTERTNAHSALDNNTNRLISSYGDGATVDDYTSMYNAQISQIASEIASSYGQVLAKQATTGFRNSGSNNSLASNVMASGKRSYTTNVSNLNLQTTSRGLQSIQQQSQYNQKAQNIVNSTQNAFEESKLRIEQLGVADNYFFSNRMWSDIGTSALNYGTNSVSTAFSQKMTNDAKNGKWF